jgi:hypothetical protein
MYPKLNKNEDSNQTNTSSAADNNNANNKMIRNRDDRESLTGRRPNRGYSQANSRDGLEMPARSNRGMSQRSINDEISNARPESMSIPRTRMDSYDQDPMSQWDDPRDNWRFGMGNRVVVYKPNMQSNVPMVQSNGNRMAVPLRSKVVRGSDYMDVDDDIGALSGKKPQKVPAGMLASNKSHGKNKSIHGKKSHSRKARARTTAASTSKEETLIFRFVNGKNGKKKGKGKLFLAKLKKV